MKSVESRVERLETQVSQPDEKPFLFVSVKDEDELAQKKAELADYKGFIFYAVGVDMDEFPKQDDTGV